MAEAKVRIKSDGEDIVLSLYYSQQWKADTTAYWNLIAQTTGKKLQ